MTSSFEGGPGFLAFVATFVLVAATIVLFWSLSKHLRKVRAREAREVRDAQEAAALAAVSPVAAAQEADSLAVDGEVSAAEVTGGEVTGGETGAGHRQPAGDAPTYAQPDPQP